MSRRRSILTPFFDALSDLRIREKIKQQEISKLFEFDKFEGKTIFKAKVLTGCETGHQRQDTTNPDNLYFPVVLRVLDITDSTLPDPEASSGEQRITLIANHPIAYSDRPYNTKLGFVPRAGQIVDCYYRDAVNKRNLVYIYPQEDSVQDEAFCGAGSLQDGFGGGAQIMGDLSGGSVLPQNLAKFYDVANRVVEKKIKHIVLHSTAGNPGAGEAQRTINRFHNGPTLRFEWYNQYTGETMSNPPCDVVMLVDGVLPEGTICHETRKKVEVPAKTSIHYAADQGGAVIQGVEEKDIAKHVGVGGVNAKSIGIEMNGRPGTDPGKGSGGKYAEMYTDTLLNAVAKLCAEICKRHSLPVDRNTIKGHEEFDPSRRRDPGARPWCAG